MNFKQGISREQISMMCPDTLIGKDNPVRVIDAFVELLDLVSLGFSKTKLSKEGRAPYEAKHLLKLFYYGYINKIRSSRKLESECVRNVELWWLMYQLTPAYHTIADFRKDNADAFKKAFKEFIAFLRGEELFDGKVVAVDGTKIRAQNNKKNNFNEGKFAKSQEYIEMQVSEYIKELDVCDALEDKQACELKKKNVAIKLEELKERKKYYTELQAAMVKSGEKQISMSDPESRSLPLNDVVTAVCFNIQAVTDSKHSLVLDFDTINTTDQGQLCPMSIKAMEALDVKEIIVLGDKGYHTGKDLQDCKKAHITTIVPPAERTNKNVDPAYQTSEFVYDKEQDAYTCPQGALLTTNGNEYEKVKKARATYTVQKYVTDQCLSCIAKTLCTKGKRKEIERSEYQDVVDENNKRTEENKLLYKTRPLLIEHVFGTIKRGWGYTYTLLKGIKKVNTEMSIIFTSYNIRRAMSILGVEELINKLKATKSAAKGQKQGIIRYLGLSAAVGRTKAA
jgi:transposase